ncbi:HSP20-like chaperone [Sparassis latifolia]|uniref:Heat shock protein n=1 Tax=Sparassis crispa TaxID=139825 RepID=A0A401GRR3_9APHY|nr:Heat shock protein [Sparassis crispa]GBE84922.1 Heat shock protein [Sparassis crispa]
MSIARLFFREMRPFFHMLEEPLGRSPAYMRMPRSLFEDPFLQSTAVVPAVDVTEEGDNYVLEAELPGVKKENVEVRIGEGGRSVIIEGKIIRRSESTTPETASGAGPHSGTEGIDLETTDEKGVAPRPDQNKLSVERSFTGSTSFARTVFLPRQIDPTKVSAKLVDGVLTVTVPRATEDVSSVQIPIQ